MRSRGPRCLLTLLVISTLACVKTIQDFVPVRRGATIDDKMRIVTGLVNENVLQRLRAELKRTVPWVSDAQLQRIALQDAQSIAYGSDGVTQEHRVFVKILIQDASHRDDQLMNAAVRLVEAALNDEVPPAWLRAGK